MQNLNSITRKVEIIKDERDANGFTLVEVLIAMIIFLVVTGAIYGLLQVGRVTRDRSSTRSDILKNTRLSLNLIGRDALNAGLGYKTTGGKISGSSLTTLLGTPINPNPGTRDSLNAIIVKNNAFPNLLTPAAANVLTDTVTFAFADLTFNGGNPVMLSKIESASGNTAQITIRPDQNGLRPLVEKNGLYLIQPASGNNIPDDVAVMKTDANSVAGIIQADQGDALGINQKMPGNGTVPATRSALVPCNEGVQNPTTICGSLKRFFLISYRVNADGTFVRRSYGNVPGQPANQQIQEVPLANNVENLQMSYVLNDGTVTDDPSNGGTTPAALNNIRQITINVIVQGTDKDKQTGEPLKIKMTSTFSTRNLAF